MTEPESPGSDPVQLQTRAKRDGDGYVLSGHKWFTSNGSIADFLIVMAVTDPAARPHQRASMFILPVDTPGVTIVRDIPTMEHPQARFGVLWGHAEIVYDNVRLAPEMLLGKEGEGFLIAQQRLVPGRIHHCMRWLGMARRAFDAMCERALYRQVKGGLLKETQTVQGWIADSAAEMQAARLMTLHAAWKIDQFGSSAARTDVSMIKFFGAKVLHDVVDRALQIHGALGYSGDMPLEELYRFARHARFVDGADEVHREAVARHLLRLYTAPDDGIPTDHVPTRRAAAVKKFADVLGDTHAGHAADN
jgi:acyl-CoA dehydrogenase